MTTKRLIRWWGYAGPREPKIVPIERGKVLRERKLILRAYRPAPRMASEESAA